VLLARGETVACCLHCGFSTPRGVARQEHSVVDQAVEPDPYLGERLREALAQDPRVGELGIAVEIHGETVILRGIMTSPDQREAAVAIVRDFLPDSQVRMMASVADLPEPTESEHLP
jgi:hypothetical protein